MCLVGFCHLLGLAHLGDRLAPLEAHLRLDLAPHLLLAVRGRLRCQQKLQQHL